MNSTSGSILSDDSFYSKSEDDLNASVIIQPKKREWKEHRPSSEHVTKKRRSVLQKTIDLNGSDKIVATTTVFVPKDGAITASSVIEAVPGDENQDPKTNTSHDNSRKKRKSAEHSNRSKSILDQNVQPIVSLLLSDM